MRILIIDSHKGSETEVPTNLHWQNASTVCKYLEAQGHDTKLIWSYPSVNDAIGEEYDVIILNHASPYCYVDQKWIDQSPNAHLVYITNEYNLGEPRILWKAAKAGRKYDVIANHDSSISKIVVKYIGGWSRCNLNAIIAKPEPIINPNQSGTVYYGSFRKDRQESFRRYLRGGHVVISTHPKNQKKFEAIGCVAAYLPRLSWTNGDLANFKASLYIEDVITHNNYNYLANRFYEAINHNVVPMFGFECRQTMELCGYQLPKEFIIQDPDDISHEVESIDMSQAKPWLDQYRKDALDEKAQTLGYIERLL